MSMDKPPIPGDPMSGLVASAVEYMVDAGQRSVLFLDVMRQRGEQYREHIAETAPNVLQLCRRTDHGRPEARRAGQLCAGAHHSARGYRDRSRAAALRRGRSPRRAWPGHRRLQGRQRDRRRHEGRSSLLLHRLSARADAGPDHRATSRGPKPCSSRRSSPCIRMPTASPA